MALTNKDIERVGEIMGARIAKELRPITENLLKLNQTTFGPTGANGLYGDVQGLRKRVGRLEKISYAAQSLLAGAIALKDKIF